MKKLLSAALAVLMISVMCVTSFAAMVDSGIDYTETLETIDNPGTGYAPGGWRTLGLDKLGTNFTTATVSPKFDLCRFSSGNDYTQSGYPSAFVNPSDKQLAYENKLIDETTLAGLDAYFAAAEAKGVLVIPRFAYTWSDTVGCEPDDINWIVTHIEQISEVLNKYPKTVIAIEAGMAGPWGEMHSSRYSSRENMNVIIGAWVDNLDSDITILCRTSNFFINYIYAENTGKQSERNALFMADMKSGTNPLCFRFGMYNDGYLGNAWDYGTWGSGTMSRADGIEMLSVIGEYAPYGGEMAYTSLDHIQGTVQGGGAATFYSDGFVKELYNTHLSYLMNIKSDSHNIKQELDKITFGRNHDFDGMPDVSVYYGQTLQKFMLDHMGFRFVIREAKNNDEVYSGESVTFEGKVENTGFGNILFTPVCELVLSHEDGSRTVIPVELDAKAFKSTKTTEYSFALKLPEGMKAGSYTAFLRLGSASYEDAAAGAYSVRFANDGVWNEFLGANYLGEFELKGARWDINGDKEFNVIDLQCVARYIAQRGVNGSYDLSACDFDMADMDGNGVIDQLDLNALSAALIVQ